jgi:LacI family transcriptional regulator
VPGGNKRVTLKDVAEATGLSPAAVSYALRGTHVSEETEQRVRRTAADLGYQANPMARALAGGATGLVGVLFGSLDDLWQQQLAAGIGRGLLALERYALIVEAGSDPARELAVAGRLRDQGVDGLIVSPVDPSASEWADLAATVPVIAVGDSLAAARTAGEVLFDNRSGVTLALEHLRALGHERITVLTPTRASTPDRPADVHVTAEAARLGLAVTVVPCGYRLPDATAVARRVLRQKPAPTALFCFADSIAHGVYAAAAELGMRVPTDLSVAGYDNHPVSALLTPALTTVDWDVESIVRASVRMVVAAIDGKPRNGRVPRSRLLRSPRLCEGASTAPPARPA